MADAVTLGRYLFGVCLVASWYNHLRNVLTERRIAYDRGAVVGDASAHWPWVVATVPFIALVVAFCARSHELPVAIAILISLVAMRRRAIRAWDEDYVVALGKYVPSAAALSGYLVGKTIGGDEAIGWEAAAGVLGAAYVLAAVAKHEQSGWRWGRATNAALLVAERAYGGAPSLFELRMWVVRSPRLCGAVAKASMAIEAAGVLYFVSSLRWAFTGVASALQLGIIVLLGYFEIEWILVIIAVTLTSTS